LNDPKSTANPQSANGMDRGGPQAWRPSFAMADAKVAKIAGDTAANGNTGNSSPLSQDKRQSCTMGANTLAFLPPSTLHVAAS
jgi:hypothetical protein